MKILKQLKLTNFLSHKKTVIDFDRTQRVIISGVSGSGKSSIVDALVWSLFGKGRAENSNLILRGETEATVVSTFIDTETKKQYEITRTINNKSKHALGIKTWVDGEKKSAIATTGIKDGQLYIEKEISGSYLLFVNSVVSPQNSTESFCDQSSSGRKDLLLEIIRSSEFDQYLKITKEKLSAINTKTEVIDSQIADKNRFISENSINLIGTENLKEKLNISREKLLAIETEYNALLSSKDILVSKLAEINSSSTLYSSIKNSIANKEEELKKLNKAIIELEMVDIKSLETDVAKLDTIKILAKTEEDKREFAFKYNNELAAINATAPAYRDYEIEILKVNKRIKEWTDQEVVKCAKCGTPYPEFEERKQSNLKQLNGELEHLVSQHKDSEEQKLLLAKKIGDLGKRPEYDLELLKKLKGEIDTLSLSEKKLVEIKQNKSILVNKYSIDINKITEEIAAERVKMGEVAMKLYGKEKVESELAELNNKIYSKNSEKTILNSEISEVQAKVMYIYNLTLLVNKAKDELGVLMTDVKKTAEEKELLGIMRETFGPNGVRAIAIDILLPELEGRINDVLSRLSDMRINIETQRSSISDEDNTLEGLFINIINPEGQVLDFSNYSGGEKEKVKAAIQEGLASLVDIGFRILDESIVGLDDNSIDQFADVILSFQENKRISQLIVISHIQQIKDLFENQLNVVKKDGISQVS
jgi:DNA repair exonuclease SbcCD ATPase subunit